MIRHEICKSDWHIHELLYSDSENVTTPIFQYVTVPIHATSSYLITPAIKTLMKRFGHNKQLLHIQIGMEVIAVSTQRRRRDGNLGCCGLGAQLNRVVLCKHTLRARPLKQITQPSLNLH